MGALLLGGAILLGVTFVFGTILAIANRYLKVEEDPRIDVVEGKLAGSNCGACGQPGCRAFAELVVKGELNPGKCTVTAAESISEIASYLGVDAVAEEKRVARLHCGGGKSCVRPLAEYQGTSSCRAAFVVNGGGRACAWGCLGLSDCEVACTFFAIKLNSERLPVVDVDKCTACGDCVDVCPLNLFTIEPMSHRLVVQCSSPLTGDAARAVCTVACDACGRCALDAAEGVIEMKNGLPVIKKPLLGSEAATWRCPTGAIQWVEGKQFQSEDEDELPVRRIRHA
jgi:Na+-translocating ferredoxin:NAD+ oxidoreductase RNF subunit RnfB